MDKIPAYCHQLMFTSRSLAVGQSACCRKVSDGRSVDLFLTPSKIFPPQKSYIPTHHRNSRKVIEESWVGCGGGGGGRAKVDRKREGGITGVGIGTTLLYLYIGSGY